MTAIQNVFASLNNIEGTISEIERRAGPEASYAQRTALASLHARRDELRGAMEALSRRQFVDLCDYRIIPDSSGAFPVKAVADALGSFQEMFTAFFGSVRENKPRQKADFSADIVQASTLNVGYSYSGSLGVVLYAVSDQLLPERSDHDLAMQAIFNLSKQESATGIRDVAEKFGRAPVKKFYDWSKAHINNEFSADIKWSRVDGEKDERLIQPPELRHLVSLIDRATDYAETTVVLSGVLVALDVKRGSFKMSFPDAADISGTFDESFDWHKPHQVPARYRASIKKGTTIHLWSEQETVQWRLLDLAEIK